MNTSTKKGFTLIEMAVVLLIIGVLAGIVLRNLSGFGVQARDTRKLADLQLINNYIAQYYANNGHFPVASTSDGLETSLKNSLGISGLPGGTTSIRYYSCATGSGFSATNNPNHYILGTILEQTTSQAPKLYENSINTSSGNPGPYGWSCITSTINCQHSNREACFAY